MSAIGAKLCVFGNSMTTVRAVNILGLGAGTAPSPGSIPARLWPERFGKHGWHHETQTHAQARASISLRFGGFFHGHGRLHFDQSVQILDHTETTLVVYWVRPRPKRLKSFCRRFCRSIESSSYCPGRLKRLSSFSPR